MKKEESVDVNFRNFLNKGGGFNPIPPAVEIINVFAKYELALDTVDIVFDNVKNLLESQKIVEKGNNVFDKKVVEFGSQESVSNEDPVIKGYKELLEAVKVVKQATQRLLEQTGSPGYITKVFGPTIECYIHL